MSGSRTVAIAMLFCACDASPELRERDQSIISGTASPNDSAVVALTLDSADCNPVRGDATCTGVLIAPRVVLTAAHCLELNPPTAFSVFFGPSLDASTAVTADNLIPVIGGRPHPAFDGGTHYNDIAALILAKDAPAGITPIPLRRTALPDLTGMQVRILGFGVDSADSMTTGVRRQGTAKISAVDTDDVRIDPGPAMTCEGDAGGPVLFGAAGAEELIGVTTWGDPTCAQFGVAARVDRYVDSFIQPVLDEANAMPPRRAFNPDEAFCSATCDTDADCPQETACFGQPGAPKHCVYHGLQPGELGEACTESDECLGICARVGGSCRRFVACDAPATPACADNGGCCSASSASARSSWWLAAFVVLVWRRRYPNRTVR